EIDDGGDDGRLACERRQALGVIDAVLQNRDAGAGAAEPLEPLCAGGRVLRLRAQKNPVLRLGLGGVGERADRDIDGAARLLDDQPVERSPDTGDQVVPAGGGDETGDGATDTAEPNDGDACWLMV